MKTKTVLRIFYGEEGTPKAEIPEGPDAAVMDMVGLIVSQLSKNDISGLNILLSTAVHLLARTPDDGFLNDFIANLQREVRRYRRVYQAAMGKATKIVS